MQIIVKLTTDCNFRCVYCSEGDKKSEYLPYSTIKKLIDELPELLDYCEDKDIELLWHGGEPLLVSRTFLEKCMDYAQKKLKKYNLKFLMQTNGYLIDMNWIETFKKYNIGIGISLDGYEELHDKNRITKKGEKTFDKILHNIHVMKEAGLSVGILMVLNTAQKVNVDQLYEFIRRESVSMKIRPVIPCGRASEIKDSEVIYGRYIELLKVLYSKCLENDSSVSFILDPLDELMQAILYDVPVCECSFNGTCGIYFFSLYSDGNIGFCGRSGSAENLIYGNLKDQSLISLYQSVQAQQIRHRQVFLQEHDCKNCDVWKLCRGGCSFEAINWYGTLEHKYPYCAQRKEFIHFLQTEGVKLLKQSLVRRKRVIRGLIKEEKAILEDLENERK